jgi:hypothetical protein
MFKRIMVWTLLVTLINSIIGCTHIATVRTEQSRKHEPPITRVELRPIIASLETSDKGEIRFDSVGGRFLLQDRAFVGLDPDGDSVRVDFKTVTGVREYRSFPDRSRSTALELSKFLKERREFNVYGVFVDTVSPRGPRIELADSSGYFSLSGSRFTGRTLNGYALDIPAEDITASWTREKRTSWVKTGLLITGSVLLVGAIAAVIALGVSYGMEW